MSATDAACERWADVNDRRLVGDLVSEDDARFAEQHVQSCALCGAEAKAWNELGDGDGDARATLSETDASAMVERALASTAPDSKKLPLRGVPTPSYVPSAGQSAVVLDMGRAHRSAYVAGAVAAAMALAAGAALLLSTRPPIVPAGPSAVLASVHGDVRVMDLPAKQGMSVAEGARVSVGPNSLACLSFDDGKVKTCLDASSELTLKYTAAEARHLALDHGTVATALDKLPLGHSFSIDARGGSATVTGTVFSVTAVNGAVIVRVHEGSVRAEGANAHGQSVTSGRELDVMSGAARPVEAPIRDHELELLGIAVPRGDKAAPPPSASSAD